MTRHEPEIPDPPSWVELSRVPDKDIDKAAEWCRDTLGINNVTARWLQKAANAGDLPCRIIAKQRRFSTADIYAFIMTRPAGTAGRAKNNLDKSWGARS